MKEDFHHIIAISTFLAFLAVSICKLSKCRNKVRILCFWSFFNLGASEKGLGKLFMLIQGFHLSGVASLHMEIIKKKTRVFNQRLLDVYHDNGSLSRIYFMLVSGYCFTILTGLRYCLSRILTKQQNQLVAMRPYFSLYSVLGNFPFPSFIFISYLSVMYKISDIVSRTLPNL